MGGGSRRPKRLCHIYHRGWGIIRSQNGYPKQFIDERFPCIFIELEACVLRQHARTAVPLAVCADSRVPQLRRRVFFRTASRACRVSLRVGSTFECFWEQKQHGRSKGCHNGDRCAWLRAAGYRYAALFLLFDACCYWCFKRQVRVVRAKGGQPRGCTPVHALPRFHQKI